MERWDGEGRVVQGAFASQVQGLDDQKTMGGGTGSWVLGMPRHEPWNGCDRTFS